MGNLEPGNLESGGGKEGGGRGGRSGVEILVDTGSSGDQMQRDLVANQICSLSVKDGNYTKQHMY